MLIRSTALGDILTQKQFSDVMAYMTYTALGAAVPGILLALFLPNHTLPYVSLSCAMTPTESG